jgi:hypothetical protein
LSHRLEGCISFGIDLRPCAIEPEDRSCAKGRYDGRQSGEVVHHAAFLFHISAIQDKQYFIYSHLLCQQSV